MREQRYVGLFVAWMIVFSSIRALLERLFPHMTLKLHREGVVRITYCIIDLIAIWSMWRVWVCV